MSQTKQFQAESKRMLDLMIHSIYTHKEIFLRELISNASDAIDKRYYQALQADGTGGGLTRESFEIALKIDKTARTLTVTDNGCGMNAAELESNLGTIARSGSLQFKQEIGNAEEIDVIGQFGVGFYAAFMVADEITVESRKIGEEDAWRWHSEGAEGFTVAPCEKADVGTVIRLRIKENTEQEQYDEFLEPYRLRELVKRYSDYIRYPIRADMPGSRPKPLPEDAPEDAQPEWETYTERQTLNSMTPLWRKNKNEITEEDYNGFYREAFHDYEPPLRIVHAATEGDITYQALLFLPAKPPANYYSKEFEKGLTLYSNGVMIMERCKDLLPDCFSFVRGIVDTQDLSLNISREMLQHDRQLKRIAANIEKKLKAELKSLLEEEREKYHALYKSFGLNLKYALYAILSQSYGMQREDALAAFLEFTSTARETPVTFAEYIAAMPEGQEYIYYASGESAAQIKRLPQCERLTEKGWEILCLTDDVDEFLFRILREIEGKELRAVADAGEELESEEEKTALESAKENAKTLLAACKEALEGKVAEVTLTTRLKTHPVCLGTQGGVSLEMERVLQSQPGAEGAPPLKAERVLEINANHPILQKLTAIQEDADTLKRYALLLYNQALLIEGFPVEDAVEFSNAICSLMV
ncbi:MAG: molecular chaperone HtpG [Oscillospiraceae bacterium]|jgi:molecular chaperone HtpG|nr:molecular chaperone HtpG [Oscillospiraceae bacterium]